MSAGSSITNGPPPSLSLAVGRLTSGARLATGAEALSGLDAVGATAELAPGLGAALETGFVFAACGCSRSRQAPRERAAKKSKAAWPTGLRTGEGTGSRCHRARAACTRRAQNPAMY
jgi:hypothetical protein